MKTHLTILSGLVVVAFILATVGAFAQATPPGRINYQGVLRDASGNPLNGLQTMTFRFYDAASTGNLLWEEIYDPTVYTPQVTVTNGLFMVALGDSGHRDGGSESSFPDVFSNHTNVYLAVKISADPEMTPRIRVVAAPFSVNARMLDGNPATAFAPVAHSHNESDVTNLTTDLAGKMEAVAPATSGNLLTSNGSVWTSTTPAFLTTEADPKITMTNPGRVPRWSGSALIDGSLFDTGTAVGIGTTSPYYKLDVRNTTASSTAIYGFGDKSGGFFKNSASGYAYMGYLDFGIYAQGNTMGGYFKDADSTGYAYVGSGDYGIEALGNVAGGNFSDLATSSTATVGVGTSKIVGGGSVNFVQNHPTKNDRVIVYACPEGDEVATYTRGTARLVNGETHVKLGQTFKWVTNPDIGLTAHLTPIGQRAVLYVASLSTSELVVKCDDPKASDVVFDFLVYGLRIGFEESSIVQEKLQEAYIPSFKDHRERYAKYPELRAYNALERFKGMESSVRGVKAFSIDLSRAKTLKDAIHEYDPATDPPVDELFGHDGGQKGDNTPPISQPAPAGPAGPASGTISKNEPSPSDDFSVGDVETKQDPMTTVQSTLPCFPVSEKVEAGDVVVMDPSRVGFVVGCFIQADPMVVGIAVGPGYACATPKESGEEDALSPARTPIVTSGVVRCKVDAGYGPVSRGDLLVASPTPGHAMRAEGFIPGTVIGKALESLDAGTGLIKVLVMMR